MNYMRNAFSTKTAPPATANAACYGLSLTLLLAACAAPLPPMPPQSKAPPAAAAPAPAAAAPMPAPPPTPTAIPLPVPAVPPLQTSPLTAAQEKTEILRKWVGQQQRLYRVAAPLLLNNTELCERHKRDLLGFTAKTRYSYGEQYIDAAKEAFGLGDQLQIISVLPGSAAAQAGLREGDILIAVGIEPLPTGPRAEHESAPLINAEMQGRTSINLSVLRNGERSTIEVPFTPACAMVINLGDTDRVNSYASGHRLLVTRGMLEHAVFDNELAYVLAREIAHNILAQGSRPDMSAVIDRLQSLNAGAIAVEDNLQPYSPVIDAAVDKLALYLLARANYDVENALEFWKKLAINDPGAAGYHHTRLHPQPQYRFSAIADAVRAIKLKQQMNQPLLP